MNSYLMLEQTIPIIIKLHLHSTKNKYYTVLEDTVAKAQII